MIERLCVIGVGLIGGSVARAVRQQGLSHSIVGVDLDPDNLSQARQLGVIDQGFSEIHHGVAGADFVLIAVPVGAIGTIFDALKSCWSGRAVYSDVGSTKRNVVAELERVFGTPPGNFIPAHPIAGSEQSGVTAARTDLFCGRRVIVTPLAECDHCALTTVVELWKTIGAEVSQMTVDQHDQVLAATSHLPHLLAFTLADMLGRRDDQDVILQFAAGGFKDFTRIASSDPTMWRDITLANRTAILAMIEQYSEALDRLAGEIERGSGEALMNIFASANQSRRRFLERYEPSKNSNS